MPLLDQTRIIASCSAYLEELRESGVDGLPAGSEAGISDCDAVVLSTCTAAYAESDHAQLDSHHESVAMIRKSLGDCHRCPLSKTRKNLVFGSGNPKAKIVFVGEGPGAEEDASGEPFVGEAGRILNRIITAMGLTRESVYICNVVKCRPPGNRNPEAEEIAACSPYLLRQIKSIEPDVIVALGNFSSHTLLNIKEPISKLRGKFHDFNGTPLMPTYHPSYLLHNSENKELFWDVWDDMTQVLRLLALPVPEKSRK